MQAYDPSHHWWLSTAWAALPLVVLLAAMIVLRLKGHISALIALAVALIVAIGIFHMPVHLAALSTMLGAGYGLFPIFWIVFPVIFMYQLTVRAGRFGLLQECLVEVSEDSRLQLLLIAFIFGAFFEGAAGFGTPVAVCGTLLLGLGFLPLEAAGLALLARDRGQYQLAFQHLIAPMLDDRTCTTRDPNPFTGQFIWTPESNEFGWTSLLGGPPGSPNVSPYAAAARATDVSGLPRTFICMGALDLFLEEDLEYAHRLMRAGVPVELHVYPGAFHAFDIHATAQVAQAARRDSRAALRRVLRGGG